MSGRRRGGGHTGLLVIVCGLAQATGALADPAVTPSASPSPSSRLIVGQTVVPRTVIPIEECAALAEVRDQLRVLLRPLAEAELRDPPLELDDVQSRLFAVEAQLANEACPQNDCPTQTGEQRPRVGMERTRLAPMMLSIGGNLSELVTREGRSYSDWFARTERMVEVSPQLWASPQGVVRNYLNKNPAAETSGLSIDILGRLAAEDAIAYWRSTFPYRALSEGALAAFRDGVMRDAAMHRLFTTVNSETELAEVGRQIGNSLPPASQKLFLAMVGRELASGGQALRTRNPYEDQYDEDRERFQGGAWRGPVGLLEMLRAYRNGDEKGVCRDNANGVARLAELMGIRDVYVVHGQNLVPHTVTVMRDPEDPTRVYRCSYQYCSSVPASGVRSLTQGEDLSTEYYLSRPDGRTAAVVPSDFKLMVYNAVFGDTTDVDFFGRSELPVHTALRIGSGAFRANLVTGVEENGNRFAGFVGTTHYGDPSTNIAAGRGGLGVFYRRTGPTEREYGMLHLSYTQFLNSPRLTPVEGLHVRIASATVLSGSLTAIRNERQVDVPLPPRPSPSPSSSPLPPVVVSPPVYEDVWAFGPFGSVLSTIGPEAEYSSRDGRTRISAQVKTQWGVGQNNPTDLSPNALRLFHNMTYASLSGRSMISPETRALLDFAVGVRDLGWQGRLSAAIENAPGTRRLQAGIEGALSPDAFSVAPGMENEAYVRGAQTLSGGMRYEVELRQALRQGARPRLNFGAQVPFRKRVRPAVGSPAVSGPTTPSTEAASDR